MHNILILTGNEVHHDFFCNSLIANCKNSNFTVLKFGSEMTDFEYFFSYFSIGLKDEDIENKSKIVEFIFDRNKTLCLNENFTLLKSSYNKKILRNTVELHEKLEEILSHNKFDLVLTYGCPIIKNNEILNMRSYNIHFGLSRFYRSGISNMKALSLNEFEKVGVTCHELTSRVDDGNVLFEVKLEKRSYKNLDEINYSLLKGSIYKLTQIINKFKFDTYNIPKGELILLKSFSYEMLIKIMANINNF